MKHALQGIWMIGVLFSVTYGYATDNFCHQYMRDETSLVHVRTFGTLHSRANRKYEAAFNSLEESTRVSLFDFGWIGSKGHHKGTMDLEYGKPSQVLTYPSTEDHLRLMAFDFVGINDVGDPTVCTCQGEGDPLYSSYQWGCKPLQQNICHRIIVDAFDQFVLGYGPNRRLRGYATVKDTEDRAAFTRDRVALRNVRIPHEDYMTFPLEETFDRNLPYPGLSFDFVFESTYCGCEVPLEKGRLTCQVW